MVSGDVRFACELTTASVDPKSDSECSAKDNKSKPNWSNKDGIWKRIENDVNPEVINNVNVEVACNVSPVLNALNVNDDNSNEVPKPLIDGNMPVATLSSIPLSRIKTSTYGESCGLAKRDEKKNPTHY